MVKMFARLYIGALVRIRYAYKRGCFVVSLVLVLISIFSLYRSKLEMSYGMGWISMGSLSLATFLSASLLPKTQRGWKSTYLMGLVSCWPVAIILIATWVLILSL